MGTRYYVHLNCAHCNKMNEEIYYAPTCGFVNFHCKVCGKENGIDMNFTATKERNIECDDDWSDEELRRDSEDDKG